MAEEKTYVFGESANNGILGLLGPMLSQRGVDPNVLLAMQGRNNDGFGEGGWFIWVIFLFFLMGWGGNGFGNNGAGGLGNQLNNDYGREMLLQAINGNGNAISSALKIKPYGEEYQYLTGEIGQSMFKIAKRFLCDDCRQKLVIEIKEIDKKD